MMHCNNCGNSSDAKKDICMACGTKFSKDKSLSWKKEVSFKKEIPVNGGLALKNFLVVVIILMSLSGFLYFLAPSKEDEELTSSNLGLVVDKEFELEELIQFGYQHSNRSEDVLALAAFNEALGQVSEGSFKHFLINGEIALIENRMDEAYFNFNEAYKLNSNDFQINSSLGLFYLDLEGVNENYRDFEKAIEHAKKAYENASPEAKNLAKENLAMAHHLNGDYEEAISLLTSVFEDAQDPYVAYLLGLIFAENADESNAKLYLEKAVEAGIISENQIEEILNPEIKETTPSETQ